MPAPQIGPPLQPGEESSPAIPEHPNVDRVCSTDPRIQSKKVTDDGAFRSSMERQHFMLNVFIGHRDARGIRILLLGYVPVEFSKRRLLPVHECPHHA